MLSRTWTLPARCSATEVLQSGMNSVSPTNTAAEPPRRALHEIRRIGRCMAGHVQGPGSQPTDPECLVFGKQMLELGAVHREILRVEHIPEHALHSNDAPVHRQLAVCHRLDGPCIGAAGTGHRSPRKHHHRRPPDRKRWRWWHQKTVGRRWLIGSYNET